VGTDRTGRGPIRFQLDKNGKSIHCLSPFGDETLKADRKAFVALMTHLKEIDASQHTVIMVQVENEVGTFGQPRDYSPKAQTLFKQQVPQAVVAHKKSPVAGAATGTWSEVYGPYADEYFHAWAFASDIEEIARAGRAVYDLPMYVNNALRDPIEPLAPRNNNFSSGGPTYDVIDIYRAVAPHLDLVAPDFYMTESNEVTANIDRFQHPDNPLLVPEMANSAAMARYIYQILGRGALGVAPFGVDYADYTNFPLGSQFTDRRISDATPEGDVGAGKPHAWGGRKRRPQAADHHAEELESDGVLPAVATRRRAANRPAPRLRAAASPSPRPPTTSSSSSATARA